MARSAADHALFEVFVNGAVGGLRVNDFLFEDVTYHFIFGGVLNSTTRAQQRGSHVMPSLGELIERRDLLGLAATPAY